MKSAYQVDPGRVIQKVVVSGGDQEGRTGETQIVPWTRVPLVDWGDRTARPQR